MNDLNTLLDLAAQPDPTPVDARADLTRGRRGLARSRTRRGAAGLVGVAAVGVLGIGLARSGSDGAAPQVATDPSGIPSASENPTPAPTPEPTVSPSQAPTEAPTDAPSVDPSAPVTGPAEPAFFDLPALPQGWEIQGSSPLAVTLAQPGDTTIPEVFEGKIVVLLDTNRPAGQKRTVDGRVFWVADETGGGTTRITVRTRADEPTGTLSVQFPTSIEWSADQAITFLAGIRVLPGAEPIAG